MKITIGIADDHQLLVKSLTLLVNSFANFEVVVDALNGKELLDKLSVQEPQPDIILIDVNMPVMDGVETVERITEKYPHIRSVALSMNEDDITIIRMIRAGCCAYLLKDIHPDELEKALNEISKKGFYNAGASRIDFRKLVRAAAGKKDLPDLTKKEKNFYSLPVAILLTNRLLRKCTRRKER